MRQLAILAFLALCGLASAQVHTRLISLPVDHFNPFDRQTFDARYLINSEHFRPEGPLFIYVSGGFDVYDDFLDYGAMFEIARDHGGHILTLEHRYYGESRPVADLTVPNLQFLTVEQALADLAILVNFVRANYNGAENSRVIMWGRNYGGMLAVWFRQKYPHLCDGVWASSAFLDTSLEYAQFMRNTFHTINSIGGPQCGNIYRGAFRMIEDAVRTRNTTYVEERLRLCHPIDVDVDEAVTRLIYEITREIGFQYVSNARYPDIDDKCTLMRSLNDPANPPDNDLDAFARWFVDEYHGWLDCLNYDNNFILSLYQNTHWDPEPTAQNRRQNLWLQCTQLGQFAIANEGEGHPFGWRFDMAFFRNWCAQAFDQDLFTEDFMSELIGRTNQFYGGLRPYVYRVFLTHGEMDPRRHLGPQTDLNPDAPVVVMSLQSSGRDFGAPSSTDYAVLHSTKIRARELITQWLIYAQQELPTTTAPPPTPGPPTPAPYKLN